MKIAFLLLTFLLAAGCAGNSGGSGNGPQDSGAADDTEGASVGPRAGGSPEQTGNAGTDGIHLEQIGAGGQSPYEDPAVVVAPSSAALSTETGVEVPESGAGTYLAFFAGQRPSGGYSVEALSAARVNDGRIEVRVAVREPEPGLRVTQALTYPYAVAVLRGVDPGSAQLYITDPGGQELGWPVEKTSA